MLFQQTGRSLVAHAPAKLNLFLEVLAKRPDGYHELETVMMSVGLYDSISFTEEESSQIRLRHFDVDRGPNARTESITSVPSDRQNIVYQAVDLLRRYAGVERGIRVDLYKRIPVAAGLAGGSSDAAATLMALNQFWNLKLARAELAELASQLGSDVSFFLCGESAAICRGRGEIVQPLLLPCGLHFVIAVPQSGLSTAAVFQHCRVAHKPLECRSLVDSLRRGRVGTAMQHLHNSLQRTAETLNDDVSRMKDAFSRLPVLGHQMSGSGTAYFGVCTSRRQANGIAARLRSTRSGHVFVAQCGP
jgi:4-diphosphocytidyl-2-C-methyl-D-erythritol kinase